MSEPTVRRGTLRAGALYEARQTAQSQQASPAELTVLSAEKQVISIDGAYVPPVKGQWAEVRTVAIGEMAEETSAAGQRELHTCHLSYFSRLTDAESFGDVAQGEMQRRGVSQAKAVCAVTDGADWMQGFVDLHRPDAVRILDFPHAAGMHWEPAHVNPLLALRTAVCSERWDEAWQDTMQQQRSQLSTTRRQLAMTRFQSQLASVMLLLLRFCPLSPKPVPTSPRPAHPAATLPGSSRPSASHPWKRAPACRPKTFAKK